jgi:hypothetical protein
LEPISPLSGRSGDWPPAAALPGLLGPLCTATAALARLDARTAAAPPALREGLVARLALREAAGWLALRGAWVHPLDLALRELGLTGAFDIAAHAGRARRAMPNTTPEAAAAGWQNAGLPAQFDAEAAARAALHLARLLRRLAGTRSADPFADVAAAAQSLGPLAPAAGAPDAARLARWRGAAEAADLPPLLAAARAAEGWMAGGVRDPPGAAEALLAAAALLARRRELLAVALPFWAAAPALARPGMDGLPRLRSDVAARLLGAGAGPLPSWPLAFLHLVAEAAQAGARELARLEDLAATGAAVVTRRDPRARLADAFAAALGMPVLTPRALAQRLKVTPQAATGLLRQLAAAGLVREITGRRSFRGFTA